MKRSRPAVCLLFVLAVSAVYGQNTRSAVSVNGSDANPCTVPQPCRTFGAALAVTNAGGEVLALDSGGYGPFTINRSVRVRAIPGAYAGIAPSSGNAIFINAAAGDSVIVAGLTLTSTGASYGILVTNVGALFIQNVEVSGFGGYGLQFGSTSATHLYIDDSAFRGNGGTCCAAVGIVPGSSGGKASLDHVRLENGYGGLYVREYTQVTMRNSSVVGNSSYGVFAGSVPAATTAELNIIDSVISNGSDGIKANCCGAYSGNPIVSITGSLISNNTGAGVDAEDLGTIRVSSTTLTRNGVGVQASGTGVTISFSNNALHGNATDGAFTQTVTLK